MNVKKSKPAFKGVIDPVELQEQLFGDGQRKIIEIPAKPEKKKTTRAARGTRKPQPIRIDPDAPFPDLYKTLSKLEITLGFLDLMRISPNWRQQLASELRPVPTKRKLTTEKPREGLALRVNWKSSDEMKFDVNHMASVLTTYLNQSMPQKVDTSKTHTHRVKAWMDDEPILAFLDGGSDTNVLPMKTYQRLVQQSHQLVRSSRAVEQLSGLLSR